MSFKWWEGILQRWTGGQEEVNKREKKEREVLTGYFSLFPLLMVDLISHSPWTHSRSNLKLHWMAFLKAHNQISFTHTHRRPNMGTTEHVYHVFSVMWKWEKRIVYTYVSNLSMCKNLIWTQKIDACYFQQACMYHMCSYYSTFFCICVPFLTFDQYLHT